MSFGKTTYNKHPTSYQFGDSNRFPHYISDGSGRDFYVKSTEGGNSHPFRWRNQTDYRFKNSLRGHNPFPNVLFLSKFSAILKKLMYFLKRKWSQLLLNLFFVEPCLFISLILIADFPSPKSRSNLHQFIRIFKIKILPATKTHDFNFY
jgi:hypothetical protein